MKPTFMRTRSLSDMKPTCMRTRSLSDMKPTFMRTRYEAYLQDVHGLDLMDVIILGAAVDLEHAVDDRQLAERAQLQLLVALLVLQAGQGLAQLIQGANGRRRLGGLTRDKRHRWMNIYYYKTGKGELIDRAPFKHKAIRSDKQR